MLILLLALIAAGCLLAWKNWRWGIAAAILVAMVQDPLRKLIPGTPAWLTMASLPVWGTVCAMALSGQHRSVSRFFSSFPKFSRWIKVFAIYLIIPAVLSATYGANSWQITLLGAVIYAATFLLLVAGWLLPDNRHPMTLLLMVYALIGAVMLIGGPLELLGLADRWPALGSQALGHVWVTHRISGSAVYMLPGFFRGPDVMGWHAITVFMIALVMAVRSKGSMRYFWIGIGVWGLLSVWLCGRRKMLAMVPIFLGTFGLLIFRFRDARRLILLGAVVLVVLGLSWQTVGAFANNSPVGKFYMTLFSDWQNQVVRHGYSSVKGTVEQAGVLGYGLGMSQQGVHNIAAERPRLWQESGPSKLFSELGIPGAVLFAILVLIYFRTAYAIVGLNRPGDDFFLYAGLFSILIANLAASLVSAQVYGDPFISLFLALLMGLLLSGSSIPSAHRVPEGLTKEKT